MGRTYCPTAMSKYGAMRGVCSRGNENYYPASLTGYTWDMKFDWDRTNISGGDIDTEGTGFLVARGSGFSGHHFASLSTKWDITSSGASAAAGGAQRTNAVGTSIAADGSMFLITIDNGATDYCYQYDMATPRDYANATASGSLNLGALGYSSPDGGKVSYAGDYYYFLNGTNAYKLPLSIKNDITSAGVAQSISGINGGNSCWVDKYGAYLFVLTSNSIIQYAFGSPHDFTSINTTAISNKSIGAYGTSHRGLTFSHNGKYMYTVDDSDDDLNRWVSDV